MMTKKGNIMSAQESINQLVEEYNDTVKKLRKTVQGQISDAFKEFMDANPSVTHIVWTQYTPYFNDGDPCEFSVHPPEFYTTECPYEDEGYQYEDGGLLEYSVGSVSDCEARVKRYADKGDADMEKWAQESLDKAIALENNPAFAQTYRHCEAMGTFIQNLEDFLEGTFGDHVQVIVTRDGVDIDEYEHD